LAKKENIDGVSVGPAEIGFEIPSQEAFSMAGIVEIRALFAEVED
jgi:hypothetical protein